MSIAIGVAEGELKRSLWHKSRGRFSKLKETLNYFGIELTDTNLTTTKGAFFITGNGARRVDPLPPRTNCFFLHEDGYILLSLGRLTHEE